ncbi:MAG: endonuclease MutS2, partial [Acidobacteriales bacterium]
MRTQSAELLDFDELKRLLGRYVSSPLGRAELDKVAPGTERSALEATLAETAEAMEYVQAASRPQTAGRGTTARLRFESLPDPAEALQRLRIEGACLEAKQIYELTELLDAASGIRQLLASVAARFPRLAQRARQIGEFRTVLGELAGKILPDGTLADHASPELA